MLLAHSNVYGSARNRAVSTERVNKEKNANLQAYLQNLSPSEASDYTLWKATKKLKQPQYTSPPILKQGGNWARTDQEKAERFAEHLDKIFTPNPKETNLEEKRKVHENLDKMQHQTYTLGTKFTKNKVKTVITKHLNAKKHRDMTLLWETFLKNFQNQESYPVCLIQLFNTIL